MNKYFWQKLPSFLIILIFWESLQQLQLFAIIFAVLPTTTDVFKGMLYSLYNPFRPVPDVCDTICAHISHRTHIFNIFLFFLLAKILHFIILEMFRANLEICYIQSRLILPPLVDVFKHTKLFLPCARTLPLLFRAIVTTDFYFHTNRIIFNSILFSTLQETTRIWATATCKKKICEPRNMAPSRPTNRGYAEIRHRELILTNFGGIFGPQN